LEIIWMVAIEISWFLKKGLPLNNREVEEEIIN
jgi:hypothetical protein